MGKLIVGVIGLTGIALVFVMLSYTGAFRDVKMEVHELGPFFLYSQPHRGAYHKIVKQLESIETLAKAENVDCKTTFGRFYDDPESVDEDRLKSDVGCFYESSEPVLSANFKEQTQRQEIPRQLFIEGSFDGAPSIGPLKVYPKMKELLLEKGYIENGAPVEIYEMSKDVGVRTRYLFPIKK